MPAIPPSSGPPDPSMVPAAAGARGGSIGPPAGSDSTWASPAALGGSQYQRQAPRERKYLGYRANEHVLRRRMSALIVDNIVSLPLIIPCALIEGRLSPGAWWLYLAAVMTYFFLMESQTGQTVGKRAAGLRVVRVDGRPVDARSIAVRTVLRLVDSIPGIPLVGALAMALTGKRHRRLGDLAAGTTVVEADAEPFVRAPRSPWITIYPSLWLGAAAALVLLIGHGGEPYLANVDAVCKGRLEAQGRLGQRNTFVVAVAYSAEETRRIALLPYPQRLSDTRAEILRLKTSLDSVGRRIVRDVQRSRNPQRTFLIEEPAMETAARQTKSRLDDLGLHACAS